MGRDCSFLFLLLEAAALLLGGLLTAEALELLKLLDDSLGAACPLCFDLTWYSKCAFWVKLFSQNWHTKGFAPVCVLICVFRFDFLLNNLPHDVH
tara:strand:- start:209 stop:493 length:285 start_codon:yes stop_codon:yes gene_type:complete